MISYLDHESCASPGSRWLLSKWRCLAPSAGLSDPDPATGTKWSGRI